MEKSRIFRRFPQANLYIHPPIRQEGHALCLQQLPLDFRAAEGLLAAQGAVPVQHPVTGQPCRGLGQGGAYNPRRPRGARQQRQLAVGGHLPRGMRATSWYTRLGNVSSISASSLSALSSPLLYHPPGRLSRLGEDKAPPPVFIILSKTTATFTMVGVDFSPLVQYNNASQKSFHFGRHALC